MAGDAWGILSIDELRACGLSTSAVMRRVRAGVLIRRYPGVYALGYVSDAPEARWMAAVKACGPGAVLSHHSAGELWGFLDLEDRLPHVTVTGNRRVPKIRIHRTTRLDPRDVMRYRGIPVTAPARTLVDLAGVVTEIGLRHALRRARGFDRVNLTQLLRTLDRLGPRRGAARLRRVIATGPAPTRTELEDVVLDLILGAGFARPDVNKPIRVAGRRLVPDFRWPAQRLILEADGVTWHDRELDRERQRLLEAAGERVLRVTWEQATSGRAATIRRLNRLLPSPFDRWG